MINPFSKVENYLEENILLERIGFSSKSHDKIDSNNVPATQKAKQRI